MQAVWDRLEQLTLVPGRDGVAGTGPLPVVLMLDPDLPVAPGLVPDAYAVDGAYWLPWSQQAQLMHRSRSARGTAELRTPHPHGDDLVAVALWVDDLHLGCLVSHVPQGASGPWTAASAQRLASGIAAALAPRLLQVWHEDRRRLERSELFALELQRLGHPAADVALLAEQVDDDAVSAAVRGEVADDDGSRTFLGVVRGGPSPEALAMIVTASLRRWLTDLPDPDPATVIDAVHTDLMEILAHLDAQVEVTVCVPRRGGRVAVATTDTAVVAIDRGGRVLDVTGPTGPTLTGQGIGTRTTAELTMTGAGFVLAAQGSPDPKLLTEFGTYAVHSTTDNPMIIASRLRSARAAERCPSTSTILVHALR